MSELKFNKATDTEHEIKLDSTLVYANWLSGAGYGGQAAGLEVGTVFVGDGAKIEIKGKSAKGKSLGKIKDTIRNDRFVGELEIPQDIEVGDEIYFEVKLSKNGLSGESNRVPAFPAVHVTNWSWGQDEARRGDVLTLSADVEGLRTGTEVMLAIYEHDQDGAHDFITEFPTEVSNGRIKAEWEYEYHEDTDEIPTEWEMERYGGTYNPPEYFFTIKVENAELGRDQESGLLLFKDFIEIELQNNDDSPIANVEYTIYLPDGEERTGTLDSNGHAREDNVPPGRCQIFFGSISQ